MRPGVVREDEALSQKMISLENQDIVTAACIITTERDSDLSEEAKNRPRSLQKAAGDMRPRQRLLPESKNNL